MLAKPMERDDRWNRLGVRIACLFFVCLNSGCLIHRNSDSPRSHTARKFFTSRWAMDDPDYFTKYRRPYLKDNKIPRMAKQMVDARHVEGKSGWGSGVSIADSPSAVHGTIGGFTYPKPWLEFHGGLSGAVQEGENDLMVGLGGGIRVQSPTRLAPFVGVGGFGGIGFVHELINSTNDDWEEDETVALFGVHPEAGVHYWLNSRMRVTGSAGYRVVTSGRSYDHWFYGVSLSWLFGSDVDELPMDSNVRDHWLESYDNGPERLPPPYPTPVEPPGGTSPTPPPYPTPVGP